MPLSPPRIVVLIVVLLFVSACSTTTSGHWHEPRINNAPYKSILVIAAMLYDEERLEIEQQTVQDLQAAGTKAHKSIYLEKRLDVQPHTDASVQAMIKAVSPDAVLVVRSLDQTVKPAKTQTQLYLSIGPEVDIYQGASYTVVWESNVRFGETEALPAMQIDTIMEATLFDIADNGRAVYSMEIDTKYKDDTGNSTYYIARNISAAITEKLKQAELVK